VFRNGRFQHRQKFRQRHGFLAVIMRLVGGLVAGPGTNKGRVPRNVARQVAKGAFDGF
jgi:hypothetical protein